MRSTRILPSGNFNIGRIYEDIGDLKKAADYYRKLEQGKNFGDGLAYGRLLLIQVRQTSRGTR